MKNQIAWAKEYIKYHPDDQGGAFFALATAIIADAEGGDE